MGKKNIPLPRAYFLYTISAITLGFESHVSLAIWNNQVQIKCYKARDRVLKAFAIYGKLFARKTEMNRNISLLAKPLGGSFVV